MAARRTTRNALGSRSSARTSRSSKGMASRAAKATSPRSTGDQRDDVRSLRLQGQRLLRKHKQFSPVRREECYQKVASMPLPKQRTFWRKVIDFLKHGASLAATACRAVYERHWNSLLWATAGFSLGWFIEAMFTIQVPFFGTVRLVHWAWKWIYGVVGAAYGIWFDNDYRTKTAAAVSFA